MQTLAPIFLVGCPRSGTTLLQQMLDAHPEVAIAPETHFIRNFWLKREQYGSLESDRAYQLLLQAIVDLPEFAEMELSAPDFIAAAQTLERSYKNLFGLVLSQFRQKRAVARVGEKTPNHLLYMQTLQEFFPEARFIHIIRDPRAVVNSWKKVPWTTGSIGGDAGVWRRYMATARQCPPADGAIYNLHYEALVSNPEASLKAICQFLGLSFQAAMLDYYRQDSKGVNVSREPWKGNAVKPVSADSLTRWQQDMTPEEIATVDWVVKDEMMRLGYEPYASGWQVLWVATQLKTERSFNRARQYVEKRIKR
ncbi:sulfotransferase family protein [Nodosilinea nodulosa]|uniref:sulfotransferase family protein n=1 Tax=Nodosilinea nodulosa TaxID=416001 RepID=UPI0003819D78|nr:sulfotransferase [Nodosilinea nodulosa]